VLDPGDRLGDDTAARGEVSRSETSTGRRGDSLGPGYWAATLARSSAPCTVYLDPTLSRSS
jgi:hypothetical protein